MNEGRGQADVYAVFVGVDWGTEKHHVSAIDVSGGKKVEKVIANEPKALNDLSDWLLAHFGGDPAQIAIGIEVPRGPVVEAMMERGFHVYWLNPKQLDRFRDRHTVAGAKDDRLDSFVLADSLRTDRHIFRRARLDASGIVQIRELSRMFDELGVDLLRSLNRLDAQLQRYYPQIKALSPTPEDRWIWDLIAMAPTPERARRLSETKVAALLRKYRIRRVTAAKTVEILRSPAFYVAPGTVEAASRHALVLVRQVQLLFEQRRAVERDISSMLQTLSSEESDRGNKHEHHDAEIILSVPGCGNHFVATVLAEASQALADRNYMALRACAGAAPVTKRSGKSHAVSMRYACNARLRRALYLAASSHVINDPRARALYSAHRARGHNHARAVRGVGDRLLKLIIAMIEARTIYDPTRRSLTREASTASIAA